MYRKAGGTIFTFQWFLIMAAVLYRVPNRFVFRIQKWLLTLAGQALFTSAHTTLIYDQSSAVQLVILSAWLGISLMVIFRLFMGRISVLDQSDKIFGNPLWVTMSGLLNNNILLGRSEGWLKDIHDLFCSFFLYVFFLLSLINWWF